MNLFQLNSSQKIYNESNSTKTIRQNECNGISFTGTTSTKRLVEEFKRKETNGNFNIKTADLESILKYFGYVEKQQTGHKHLEGFYGNKYQYKSEAIAHENFAATVIRGIKLADEFDGALFLFVEEPSEEEKERCKKLIKENPPYLDPRNKYAQRLKEQRDAEKTEKLDSSAQRAQNKESFETILEQRMFQIELSQNVQEEEKRLNNHKDTFIELKNLLKKEDAITEEEIANFEEKYDKQEELIAQTRKLLSQANIKLQKNEKLEQSNIDEENSLLNKIQKKNEELEILNDEFSIRYFELNEKIIGLQEEINKENQEAFNLLKTLQTGIKDYLQTITNVMQDENVNFMIDKKALKKYQSCLNELKQKATNVGNDLSKIKKLSEEATSKDYKLQLETVRQHNDSIKALTEEFKAVASKIEKNIITIANISQADLEKRSNEQLEKFKQKRKSAKKDTTQAPPQDEKKADTSSKTESATIKKEKAKTAKPEDSGYIYVIEKKDGTEKLIKAIILDPSKTEDKKQDGTKIQIITAPKSVKQKNYKDESADARAKFATALARKLAPIPMDGAILNLSLLIKKESMNTDMEQVKNNPNANAILVNGIANKVMSTNEAQEIKKATRFAVLDTLYQNSIESNEEIYTLDAEASKTAYSKIKQGETTFNVISKGQKYTISLKDKVEMEKLENLYFKFHSKMSQSVWLDEVLNKLMKYAPNTQENIETKAKELLKEKGSYFELLETNQNKTLQKILLEEFWTSFDNENNANMRKIILDNFDKEQNEILEKEYHQEKLDLFESLDWEL